MKIIEEIKTPGIKVNYYSHERRMRVSSLYTSGSRSGHQESEVTCDLNRSFEFFYGYGDLDGKLCR